MVGDEREKNTREDQGELATEANVGSLFKYNALASITSQFQSTTVNMTMPIKRFKDACFGLSIANLTSTGLQKRQNS